MIMNQPITDKLWHEVNFADLEKRLNGLSQSPLHKIRRDALQHFTRMGFPSTRKEEWRFTDVSPLQKTEFRLADEIHIGGVDTALYTPFYLSDPLHSRLVFLNGQYIPELSTIHAPEGVQMLSMAYALRNTPELVQKYLTRYASYSEREFTALNTAFLHDGAFLYVPDNVVVEKPVHFLYLTSAEGHTIVTHPRNLVVAGANSRVTVLESYAGADTDIYFTNPVTEVITGENSVVEHYKIQQESLHAYHVAALYVHQQRSSNVNLHSFSFGGAIVRNDVIDVLDGEGSSCVMNGLYLTGGSRLIDNHTIIDHAQPHCNSREVYHGILDDKARGVFSGKIHVRPDAQKTDAIQSNKNLLLSENATVDTKPQLEIYADDVRCTHGGTVGQIDENGVFYLRSRGINEKLAKEMMIHAFAGEIIKNTRDEEIHGLVDNMVLARLENGHIKY
jgi:Fe-S cluster assembly protein SufD